MSDSGRLAEALGISDLDSVQRVIVDLKGAESPKVVVWRYILPFEVDAVVGDVKTVMETYVLKPTETWRRD